MRSTPIVPIASARSLVSVLVFCLSGSAGAQQVSTFQKTPDGVVFGLTGQRSMKLEVYAPNIIRVAYTAAASVPSAKGFVVIRDKPAASTFSITEESGTVTMTTSRIRVSVSRSDASLQFDGDAGAFLSEKFAGRTLTAITGGYRGTLEFNSPTGEGIYGFGQKQNGLMNQRDAMLYLRQENTSDYVPFFTSTRGYGVLINHYSRGVKNPPLRFSIDRLLNDALDYFVIHGPEIDTVIAGYRFLTGAAPLNGKWAYGYWQSKNRYASQTEILDVVSKYRQNGIPLDNIVVDWKYWDPQPWGSHYFNPAYWPNPSEMNSTLHSTYNAHCMISVWGMFHSGSANYDELKAADCLVGVNYNPVDSACAQMYWRQVEEQIMDKGFDALWLDATEPEQDWNVPEYGNIYSLMSTKCVYENQRRRFPHRRVYTLTRSVYAGQQRYGAASWSGDIARDFATLRRQIPAGLNIAHSGQPYWTTDIGGYIGPTTNETFIRWFQYGAFCPIFRTHGVGAPVIYAFGTPSERQILIDYNKLRYRLMPYVYSLAWKVASEGYTPMRGLTFDFRTDPTVRDIADQFMFGPAFLINPVTTAGATTRQVYLPPGKWHDFWTGAPLQGAASITAAAPLDRMPLYVRAGSIVPMGPEIQWATEKPADPIELRVYDGADGQFTIYEDENEGYGYEQGRYSIIPVRWSEQRQTLTIGDRQGSFPGMLSSRNFNVVWVSPGNGAGGAVSTVGRMVTYSGKSLTIDRTTGQVEAKLAVAAPGQGTPKVRGAINGLFFTGMPYPSSRISLLDASGRRIFEQTTTERALMIRGLPAGCYLVRINGRLLQRVTVAP